MRTGRSLAASLVLLPGILQGCGRNPTRLHRDSSSRALLLDREEEKGSTVYMTGACDASAAVKVGADSVLVADDEDQKIRNYSLSRGGGPVSLTDVSGALALTDTRHGEPREVDIEAATRVGDRIYWIGSHSNSAKGKQRPNRRRLFATDLVQSGGRISLSVVGAPFTRLREQLVDWDNQSGGALKLAEAIEGDPKRIDGFNIEGLSVTPDGKRGFIGFRAPVVDGQAILVPLQNMFDLATGAASQAALGEVIRLDLGGRGVRDIACNRSGCLLIAGPAGSEGDFKLFTWSGDPANTPKARAASLAGLNPEGIVELPEGPLSPASKLLLVSDNGTTDWYGDGTRCKDLSDPAQKKFRLDRVVLGEAESKSATLRR